MGPPGLRRRLRCRLPRRGEAPARDPRLGGRALTAAADRSAAPALRVRWLGTVAYHDAHALQHGLYADASRRAVPDDWLLLLEHPHVFTLGTRGDPAHVLVRPDDVGAILVTTDRGGDVTYHGPGQLVGYPILSLPGKHGGGMADTVAYVRSVEQLVIDVLADLGLPDAGRLDGYPGVWVAPGSDPPRKIAAIGVRLTRGRTMHGFALNVAPDMAYFGHIVPCGIADKAVTSLAAEGVDVTMREVVDLVTARAVERWAADRPWERADVVWRHRADDLAPFSRGEGPGTPAGRRSTAAGAPPVAEDGVPVRLSGRLAEAGVVQGLAVGERKPEWLRAKARMGDDYLQLKRTMRDLDLVTVCEEAGCPNIYECWADGTATFMINGERCTRACGFCLVDTRKPDPLDVGEPERVADAVERMGLRFVVLTAVARDDLDDGGAEAFAHTIEAVRRRRPDAGIEVLIPDCKGDAKALDVINEAAPDVVNHNLETVARLQRAVRPSASYARSLGVLARAKAAGRTTKSGIILGMGEEPDEVVAALADLAGVGVDIVTLGQYLRPTSHHLPVARWWTPDEFAELARIGTEQLGIGHVEASPLTRSSYHAASAVAATTAP
ncbi:MAG: lipoyl synthase [Acidimicrobiales bacterium]